MRHYLRQSPFPSSLVNPLPPPSIIHHPTSLSITILYHTETLDFLITSILSPPLILDHRWIVQHNRLVSWTNNCILQWGLTIQNLTTTAGMCSRSNAPVVNIQTIQEEYLAGVFSHLPLHHPYNLAIDFLPDLTPPCIGLFSPSVTKVQAPLFLCGHGVCQEKGWHALSLCQLLGDQSHQHEDPLPLTITTLNAHTGATYFKKSDLWSVYNLVHIQEGDEWKMAFIPPLVTTRVWLCPLTSIEVLPYSRTTLMISSR